MSSRLRFLTPPLIPAGGALRGIALFVGASVFFSLMNALVRIVGSRYPVTEVMFFRSVFGFVPFLYFLYRAGGVRVLATRRLLSHISRSIVGVVAMVCAFAALPRLPLADATVLGFAAPIMTTALASVLLGEKVGPRRWSAVIAGFVGVVVATLPHANLEAASPLQLLSPGAMLALVGAFFTSLAMISVRRLAGTENSLAIVFYFTATTALAAAVTLPFDFLRPRPQDAPILIAMGLTGGFGQVLMTTAYRHAPASTIAPFSYLAIVWALILGYVIDAALPGPPVLLGAAIVVAAGLYIIRREHKLRVRAE